MGKTIKIRDIEIGNELPLTLIAGPDSMEEDYDRVLSIVSGIKEACDATGVNYIMKASYDKANRTSIDAFRGVGMEKGLEYLERYREDLDVPVTTDVHTPEEAVEVGKVVDLIQIPALLSRQTDLLVAAGKTGKPVNVKKGQFMAPGDIGNVIKKVTSSGNEDVSVTERGYAFGYGNLVSDMRGLEIMKQEGYPVIFDGAHSVQLPSGQGSSSDGQREFIPPLARAATAVGIAGLFLEIYDKPEEAPCDGPNSLKLSDLKDLLTTLKKIDEAVK